MNPKHYILLDLIRITGLMSRCVITNNTHEFLRLLTEIVKVCNTAIKQLTFRVVDLEDGVDDDEL